MTDIPSQHPQYMEAKNLLDPIERRVALGLCYTSVKWINNHPLPGRNRSVDFYIPEWDTYIECVRLGGATGYYANFQYISNLIMVQGMDAANMLYFAFRSASASKIQSQGDSCVKINTIPTE